MLIVRFYLLGFNEGFSLEINAAMQTAVIRGKYVYFIQYSRTASVAATIAIFFWIHPLEAKLPLNTKLISIVNNKFNQNNAKC